MYFPKSVDDTESLQRDIDLMQAALNNDSDENDGEILEEIVNMTKDYFGKESGNNSGIVAEHIDEVINDDTSSVLMSLEAIQTLRKSIQGCVRRLADLKADIDTQMCSLNGSVPKSEEGWKNHKKVICLFASPYFRDLQKRVPPPNEDSIMKRKNKDVDAYTCPPRPWSRLEHDLLLQAVEANCKNCELDPLNSKKEYYLDKLKHGDYSVEETDDIKDKIKKISKEIEKVRMKPLEECLSMNQKLDWMRISAYNENLVRNHEECSLMWYNYLHPSINKKKWTKSEDEELVAVAERHQFRDWESIANNMTSSKRTAIQCFERYQFKLNPTMVKSSWTAEDDKELKTVIERYKIGDYIPWSQVAYHIEGRTRRQIRQRWYSCINVNKRGPWSQEEDAILLAAVEKYGSEWKTIAEFLPGRANNAARQRYTRHLLPGLKIGNWTDDEDKMLINCVRKYGEGKWIKIVTYLPGRTNSSVLSRAIQIKKSCPDIFKAPAVEDYQTLDVPSFLSCRRKYAELLNENIRTSAQETILESLMKIKGYKTPQEAQGERGKIKSSTKALFEVTKQILGDSVEGPCLSGEIRNTEKIYRFNEDERKASELEFARLVHESSKTPEERAVDEELKAVLKPLLFCDVKKKTLADQFYQTPKNISQYCAVRSLLFKAFQCKVETSGEDACYSAELYAGISELLKSFVTPKVTGSEVPVFPPNRSTTSAFKSLLVNRSVMDIATAHLEEKDISTLSSIVNCDENSTLQCSSCSSKEHEAFQIIGDGNSRVTTGITPIQSNSECHQMSSEECGECKVLNEIKNEYHLFRKRFISLFFWPAILTLIPPGEEQKKSLIDLCGVSTTNDPEDLLRNRNARLKNKRKNSWMKKHTEEGDETESPSEKKKVTPNPKNNKNIAENPVNNKVTPEPKNKKNVKESSTSDLTDSAVRRSSRIRNKPKKLYSDD